MLIQYVYIYISSYYIQSVCQYMQILYIYLEYAYIAVYICIAGCSALVISSYFMRDDIPVVGKHRNCLSPIRKNPPAIFWAIASPFLEIFQLFSKRLCSTYAQSPAAANLHGHGSKC